MTKLISEEDVVKAIQRGSKVIVAEKGSIITPLALDMIRSKKLTIIEKEIHNYSSSFSVNYPFKKIAIGSDHTGFKVKNILIKYLTEKSYHVYDLGTMDEKSCDYPDFAEAVSETSVQPAIVILGGVTSTIVTSKLHVAELPSGSVTV